MDLGLIGLGNMGIPMLRRLLDAGHSVVVSDVNPDAVAKAVGFGATAASSPREVADRCDLVAVSLPSPEVLRAVALGPDGIAQGSRAKRLMDLSTTGSRAARAVAEELGAKGIAFIDAPVSGGVSGAAKGTLAVMAACSDVDFAVAEPVLKLFGRVFHVGLEPGMAQTMKLLNNYLSGTALAATAEAMVFGAKAGLDPDMMVEVVNAGSGRNSASQDKFPRSILTGSFDFGFLNVLMYKDIKLFTEEAEAAGVALWIAPSVRQVWQHTVQHVGPQADFTTVVQPYEQWASVEVRSRKSKPA